MSQITVQKMSREEADKLGIASWEHWDCEPAEFDWEYDSVEKAYLFEGTAIVTAENGETTSFGAGDFVTFPKGLKCRWKVIETVKKVYKFE